VNKNDYIALLTSPFTYTAPRLHCITLQDYNVMEYLQVVVNGSSAPEAVHCKALHPL